MAVLCFYVCFLSLVGLPAKRHNHAKETPHGSSLREINPQPRRVQPAGHRLAMERETH